jgi:large subunit ribosomal protein L17
MRHAKKGRKLGTDASHRTAMMRGLARALFLNERIKTTEARAKEVRSLVDRIIGWGKRGDVHARRLALAELNDRDLVHKIFADIAPRFAEREGGYTRILKLGPRKGDAAPMVIIELVD